MSISNAYTDWSATYDTDRNLTRDLDAQVTRQTFIGQHFRTILETGCGTGKNTVFYADIADNVIALDFSEGMLAQARSKITQPNVTFAVADLTKSWQIEDQSVDLVACNLVLEHIPDLNFVFSEARHVLSVGGQFFVSELHPFRQYQGKRATFAHGDQQIDIPAYTHHISDYVSAAQQAGLRLLQLNEWWHESDADKPPRVVSFIFEK